ncbi:MULTISPECIES: MFS transporter [unclassified Rhizobium]|uniref:MFS transporter n=1 Tax=unclassified Rhizobium TaxID=2613769 RepID=UPI00381D5A6B
MRQSPFHLPLVVGLLALAQAVSWGMTFNLSAITGRAMGETLGLPYVVVMAGPTVMLVVMALIAVPLLRLFERFGARLVMTASVALGALGLVVVGLATGPWTYFLGWGVIGAAGAGMLTTAVQIAIAELFGARARATVGALMVFGGLGTTLCWPLLGGLQAAFGWRMATLIGAAALLTVVAPIYWLLLAKRPATPSAAVKSNPDYQLDWIAFGLLAFSTASNGIVTWGFSLTIITLFEARGLSHATAILTASFIGVAALAARLVDFVASRRWNSLATGLMAGFGLPISFAILMLGSGELAAGLFAIIYGLTSGVLAVARSTMTLDLFPVAAYARASSMLALPMNLSFACAPPLFA